MKRMCEKMIVLLLKLTFIEQLFHQNVQFEITKQMFATLTNICLFYHIFVA